jgi:hypothetical protein
VAPRLTPSAGGVRKTRLRRQHVRLDVAPMPRAPRGQASILALARVDGTRFVAPAATSDALLLRPSKDRKENYEPPLEPAPSCPPVREDAEAGNPQPRCC